MTDPQLLRLEEAERTTLARYLMLQRNFYVGDVLEAAGSLWAEAEGALSEYRTAQSRGLPK